MRTGVSPERYPVATSGAVEMSRDDGVASDGFVAPDCGAPVAVAVEQTPAEASSEDGDEHAPTPRAMAATRHVARIQVVVGPLVARTGIVQTLADRPVGGAY
ncbi:hypothetical protein GCM10009722_02640 [Williamsia deligens]